MRSDFLKTSTKSPTQTQEVYTYTYDHAMRLTRVSHQLNTNAAVTLAQHTYDDLGRLRTKMNHSATVNTATYAYNLRSWLTDINGSKFTQNLYYNTGSGTLCYNGNISSMLWKSGTETVTRGYKFNYDELNRLTAANYQEGTSTITNEHRFSEKGITYDYNGNIRKLERRDKSSASSYGIIDNLTLGYNGNQLINVTDAATDPTFEGNFNFVDGSKITGTEYIYDKNGNMVQDFNKKIANISYNFLNLPGKQQFGYGHMAEYLYDGAGVKRQMISNTVNQNLSVANGSFKEPTAAQKASVKTTDYVGNIIYENGTLSMILTGEGYLTLSGTTPTYHYYLKDHQGNNRVVVNQSGTVMQVNHYYPFGGVFGGEGVDTAKQPFKYNDKEFDRTNGLDLYDYSARFMDAALGRFTTIDPLAEKYYGISPYVYCANNPVRYIDPDGRFIGTTLGGIFGGVKGAYKAYKDGESVRVGVISGAMEGAVTGFIIDAAITATVATGGGALAIMGAGATAGVIGGAIGGVAGDVVGQIATETLVNENTFSEATKNISTDNFINSAVNGAIDGALHGITGGVVGTIGKAATASTKMIQGTMSNNITGTATALTNQGASQGVVNSAVNSISTGMGKAGLNTTKSMMKIEGTVTTSTETLITVRDELLIKNE